MDVTLSSIDTLLEMIAEFYNLLFEDDVEFLRQEVLTNEVNATIGVLEFRFPTISDLHQSLIFYKVGINMIGFSVSSNDALADDISSGVEAIIHSIQHAEP